MTTLLTYLLTLLLVYGYPIVFVSVVVSAVGLPIPVTAILLAAGSFCADGTLNIWVLLAVATTSAVIGDVIGYWLGLKLDSVLAEKYGKSIGLTPKRLRTVQVFFDRWGLLSIFITRWLLTPLGLAINMIAGMQKFSFRKFMVVVVGGELLWAIIYVCLGYEFGTNWQVLVEYLNNAPRILALVCVGGASLFVAVKMKNKVTHRITE